ncbi:hypothetical protein BGZ63DRAFT_11693 [Mariannaea sp. PMI_226]|nr:hypothetical protein BGZ63DRAFT_11693 [Mariannaea sp. PMI_226]
MPLSSHRPYITTTTMDPWILLSPGTVRTPQLVDMGQAAEALEELPDLASNSSPCLRWMVMMPWLPGVTKQIDGFRGDEDPSQRGPSSKMGRDEGLWWAREPRKVPVRSPPLSPKATKVLSTRCRQSPPKCTIPGGVMPLRPLIRPLSPCWLHFLPPLPFRLLGHLEKR